MRFGLWSIAKETVSPSTSKVTGTRWGLPSSSTVASRATLAAPNLARASTLSTNPLNQEGEMITVARDKTGKTGEGRSCEQDRPSLVSLPREQVVGWKNQKASSGSSIRSWSVASSARRSAAMRGRTVWAKNEAAATLPV